MRMRWVSLAIFESHDFLQMRRYGANKVYLCYPFNPTYKNYIYISNSRYLEFRARGDCIFSNTDNAFKHRIRRNQHRIALNKFSPFIKRVYRNEVSNSTRTVLLILQKALHASARKRIMQKHRFHTDIINLTRQTAKQLWTSKHTATVIYKIYTEHKPPLRRPQNFPYFHISKRFLRNCSLHISTETQYG